MTLSQWAQKWGVLPEALADLQRSLGAEPPPAPGSGGIRSESWAQSLVRLEAAALKCRLWRNNVGSLLDTRGVPVRFGLANDSPEINARIKSADLIGIKPVVVTPQMVGRTVGVFLSREIKRPGWKYSPADSHERAQMNWALLVRSLGGDAGFATGRGTIDTSVNSGDTAP